MVVDLVCRMTLSEEKAVEEVEYKGKTYYFCGKGCKERFENDPERYLEGEKKDWIRG
jgi:YHS domain-containing protein